MSRNSLLAELVGRDLSEFKVVEMTEVYRVDEDGRKSKSLGYSKDPNVAQAFAGNQTDSDWHKTTKALVLTNGKMGFLIDDQKPVKLFDDEAEAAKAKEAAIMKLSEAERKLLGY